MEKSVFSAKDLTKFLIGGGLGYVLFTLTSHPSSRVHKRLPSKQIRNVSVLPQIKITRKNMVIHFHHWILFSFLYVSTLSLRRSILGSKILHGFILGSIIQGLSYKDRFRIYYPALEIVE